MASIDASGGCLCGIVKYRISGEVTGFYLCHCSRCRKATGSAHASNIFTLPDNLEWLSGEVSIRRYELPEADRFTRQFCIQCGSGLPYVSRNGAYLVIPAGSLDGALAIRPQANIYWNSRANWYDSATDACRCEEGPG